MLAVRVLANVSVVMVVEVLVGLVVLDVSVGQCSEVCGRCTLYYWTHRGFLESVLFDLSLILQLFLSYKRR